jgi:hypothetical protein
MIVLPNYRAIAGIGSITNNFYRDFKSYTLLNPVINSLPLPGNFQVYRGSTTPALNPASYFDAAGVLKYVYDYSLPRFNYIFNTSVMQMTSDGLLVEQSRTNYVLPSSSGTFGRDGSKYVLNNVTVAGNQLDLTTSAAVSGYNGLLIRQTATTGTHYFQLSTPNSAFSSAYYTVSTQPWAASVYVQQYQTTPYLEFHFHDGAGNGVYTFLDLNQGTVTIPSSLGTMSNVLSTTYVELISNVNFSKPWYRVTATGVFNVASGNGMFMNLYPADDNVNHAPSVAGSINKGVYACCFQLENCAANVNAVSTGWTYGPSTYIPASSTSFRTRQPERLYVTNGNGINWSNTTKHTWYVKYRNTYHIGKAPNQSPLITMGQLNGSNVPQTSGNSLYLNLLVEGIGSPTLANYFSENTVLTYGWVVGTSGTTVSPSGQACFINGGVGYTGFTDYSLTNVVKSIPVFGGVFDTTYGATWPNVMFIGSQGGGSQFVHGTLQYVSHTQGALDTNVVLARTGTL